MIYDYLLKQSAEIDNTVDLNFNYVTCLLNCNGTNGGQNNTILDTSSLAATPTKVGTITQGSVSPHSHNGWSVRLGGNGTDQYLSAPASSAFLFTGDYTIEFWMQVFSLSNVIDVVGNMVGTGNTTADWTILVHTAGRVEWYPNRPGSVSGLTGTTSSITTHKWFHVACTRSGTTARLFVDGIQQASNTRSGTHGDNSRSVRIGARSTLGTSCFDGIVSNLRIVNGTAVYTSNFTPPTTTLTTITNTTLLTCASNRFMDKSTNNLAITSNGTSGKPSIIPRMPFLPTAGWDAATNGGSLGFSAGAYLTFPNPAGNNYDFGSSNFTIECWHYPTTIAAETIMVSKWNSGGTTGTNQWLLKMNSAVPQFLGTTTGTSADITVNGPSIILNAWNHIAAVRNGTSFTVYVNGVAGTSVTNAGTLYASETEVLGIAYFRRNGGTPQLPITGNLTDVRIVKGTAVYTSAFTPPTAPLTAITNTQFLLSGTNASINDESTNAMLNTVGVAQLSTSTTKYGSASVSIGTATSGGSSGALQMTSAPTFFGTDDFTVESWVYTNAIGTTQLLFGFYTTTGSSAPLVYINSSNALVFEMAGINRTSGASISASTWYHVALCRASGVTRLFLNGSQVGSNFTDGTNYGTLLPLGIGDTLVPLSAANRLNGYVDDFRITSGKARYTSTFTPPGELPNF